MHDQKNREEIFTENYAAVVPGIQSEWIFLQCATKNMGDAFAGVENMIRETFLPYLFLRKPKSLSPIVGTQSTMPVNKSGLGLLNPMITRTTD